MRCVDNMLAGLLASLSVLALGALASIVAGTANANVDYVPKLLEKAVATAEIVARVRIDTVNETPCGNDYSAHVLKTYKGKAEPTLTFTARRSPITQREREVHAGDELLLLLSARAPEQAPYDNSCCSDTPSPPPPKAELQCRAKLASYTPLKDFESSFLLERRTEKANGKAADWLWYESIRTQLPADIERTDTRSNTPGANATGKCTGPFCIVRWSSLERRLVEWTKMAAGKSGL